MKNYLEWALTQDEPLAPPRPRRLRLFPFGKKRGGWRLEPENPRETPKTAEEPRGLLRQLSRGVGWGKGRGGPPWVGEPSQPGHREAAGDLADGGTKSEKMAGERLGALQRVHRARRQAERAPGWRTVPPAEGQIALTLPAVAAPDLEALDRQAEREARRYDGGFTLF